MSKVTAPIDEQKPQPEDSARNKYLLAISHELRTPLNVIMGYAQILENQAVEQDPNKEKYTLMRHNCEHLAHLIEGILEFSAIESGKLKVHQEWIDLSEMLKQLSLMFSNQATKKGLAFTTHFDEKLPKTVKSDHKRLQQILINLLSNAIKFTTKGQIDFSVKYRNQVATFSVKDTGCGIDQSDLEKIFIPFERLEQGQHKTPGTGLGLPITQMLAELLGGELTVNSELSIGSEFTYRMMLAPQTAFNQMPESNQAALNNEPRLAQRHEILVVDDEASHRQLLTDVLKTYDFSITTAVDGVAAKKKLLEVNFELAIIDVAMPNMNGWQLAKWINEYQPKTKIIMLSGNPRDQEKSLAVQYHNYLSKPVNINQLMSQISEALNLNWQKQTNSATTNEQLKTVGISATDYAALHNMIAIGHINGIENYLQGMLEANRLNEPQHKQLIAPVKNMNLTQFTGMIKRHDQH
ncbi:ATP-binding response regulator [Marinicella marina]|uniref:ATP-binding response regulator n=1 Tax=Marinicella marina TaxID=2996016 RepID=UPI0024BD2DD7|nr:ATP-binding protein [Marinicella marina]